MGAGELRTRNEWGNPSNGLTGDCIRASCGITIRLSVDNSPWISPMSLRWFLVTLVFVLGSSLTPLATQVSQEEMDKRHQWVEAKFAGKELVDPAKPRLLVLANHQKVNRDKRTYDGQPLNISGTTYTKGLSCHALSKIVVKLTCGRQVVQRGGGRRFHSPRSLPAVGAVSWPPWSSTEKSDSIPA